MRFTGAPSLGAVRAYLNVAGLVLTSPGTITSADGDFTLDASGNVTITGTLTATAANITGTITGTAGSIGGWTIGAAALTGGDATLASAGDLTLGTGNNVARVSATDATYRLWAGHATAASAPFRVTKTGALTATSATITGTITATSGTFTGTINATGGSITGAMTVSGVLTVSTDISMASGARLFLSAGSSIYNSAAGETFYNSTGTLRVADNAYVTGDTYLTGDLRITGDIQSDVTIGAGLDLTLNGGDIDVTGAIDATGNITAGGYLTTARYLRAGSTIYLDMAGNQTKVRIGSLRQLYVGPLNSGGSGYRVVRVPN